MIVNVITFTRLIAGILVAILFYTSVNAWPLLFAILYIFISDLLDGYLARKLKAQTSAGAIFDYTTDRFNFYILVGICIEGGASILLFIPFFIRDLLYIFVQVYIQLERINGTKSMSFLGTASVYIYVLYIALFDTTNSLIDYLIIFFLCISLFNLLLRIYRMRDRLMNKFLDDLKVN